MVAFTTQSILGNLNTAATLIQRLLGSNQDKVAIFLDDKQILKDARPIKTEIREAARIFEHPIESGANLADHHIIMPAEILISFYVSADSYASVFSVLHKHFVEATLLKVQLKEGVYRNMIVAEKPHESDPDVADAIKLHIRFKQAYIVKNGQIEAGAMAYSPADETQADAVVRGIQKAKSVATAVVGVFSHVKYTHIFKR